jgi:nucleoside-diphosphate-sugar epimerase
MVADAAKLRQLGWQEQVGFEPGLRRLYEQLSRRR